MIGVGIGHTAVDKGVLTLGTELEGVDDTELVSSENKGDKDYSDDVLVIPNEFPDTLTRICYPRFPNHMKLCFLVSSEHLLCVIVSA